MTIHPPQGSYWVFPNREYTHRIVALAAVDAGVRTDFLVVGPRREREPGRMMTATPKLSLKPQHSPAPDRVGVRLEPLSGRFIVL